LPTAPLDPEDILRKLARLRAFGASDRVFGSAVHRFELRPPLEEGRLASFEDAHQVTLPRDYRQFLTHCGNGGAGPYYGLFPLGTMDGLGLDLQPWREGDGIVGSLAAPFPHTEAWNLPEDELEPPTFSSDEHEDQWHQHAAYWAPHLANGAFPICHQGCAYRNILVVNGPEYGYVWVDARPGDGGLLPEVDETGQHLAFGDWYTRWLEQALITLSIR
jgi:hypothetical protein